MNERIKELIVSLEPDAFMTYKGYLCHSGDPKVLEHSDPEPLYTRQELEKFAELIVQECASQARQKAKIIKTKTETYSDDVGEMSVGLSVAWQFEVFAQEIEEYFRSEL